MRALALDMAGLCGWAVTPQESGVWDIRPRHGDSVGMRYIYLRQHLEAVRRAHPDLVLVAYEKGHHRGGAATAYALGYEAVVQEWCATHGIEHTAVKTGELKKHATGRGGASKLEMVEAARRRGWAPVDDNHADALHLLDYALHRITAGGTHR